MYIQDQALIQKYAFDTNGGFIYTGTFVLLTIQQPLDRVKHSMDQVKKMGIDSAHLWGVKKEGYMYLNEHAETLRTAFRRISITGDAEVAMALALSIPGLGLPKAGFFCQLLGFDVGCFDVHNIKRFGMKLSDFKLNKKATTATRAKKIKQYCNVCYSLGGAENLWDGWCQYVSDKAVKNKRYNTELTTAELVSKEHLVALGLDR
jgi:hypothetical protein